MNHGAHRPPGPRGRPPVPPSAAPGKPLTTWESLIGKPTTVPASGLAIALSDLPPNAGGTREFLRSVSGATAWDLLQLADLPTNGAAVRKFLRSISSGAAVWDTLTAADVNPGTFPVGTYAVQGLIDASAATAGQVKFPVAQNASADAHTQDDYAEIAWTPTIGGDGGQTGQVYAVQSGAYTKIGRLVVAEFDVLLSTLGTVTGNVQVQGLPVASGGSGSTWQSIPIWLGLSTAVTSIPARLQNGATAATLFKVTAAATSSAAAFLQSADLSNTSRFGGRFIYYSA